MLQNEYEDENVAYNSSFDETLKQQIKTFNANYQLRMVNIIYHFVCFSAL